MCGIGGKADRHPIDPPAIVQLRVIDPAASSSSSHPASSSSAGPPPPAAKTDRKTAPMPTRMPYTNLTSYAQSFLQNPYYFMFALLAKPDDDTELHWHKDGRTRCTSGSVVNTLYAFKDPPAPDASTNNGHASGSPATAKYRPMTASLAPMRASSSSPTSPSARRVRTASSSVCSSLWERRPPLQEHLQRALLCPHCEKVPRCGILSPDLLPRRPGHQDPHPEGHTHTQDEACQRRRGRTASFWSCGEHAHNIRAGGGVSIPLGPSASARGGCTCAQQWGCRSSIQTGIADGLMGMN
ncbi:hypothetical protein K438DRAFT_882312 [Mycena galopus ATCC 62051]|nr:hypothetical protein K438DRAFT_882312 [Mycena galopus ATCC 62051]